MSGPVTGDRQQLLDAKGRVPQHVVHRTFVAETVLLNLQTGKYHGVNPVGGKMLEYLDAEPTVRAAAVALAEHFGRPVAELEEDLCEFCLGLRERGLLELA